MGSTGVALSRDGSGPFLNPAGTLQIRDTSLTLAASFFSFKVNWLDRWHDPTRADSSHYPGPFSGTSSTTTAGFSALPSTFCLFIDKNRAGLESPDSKPKPRASRPKELDQRLAACIAAVEREDFGVVSDNYHQALGASATNQGQTLRRLWQRFQFGPTWSLQVSDDVGIGASLHGIYTQLESAWGTDAVSIGKGGGNTNSAFTLAEAGHSLDVAAVFGVTVRANRRLMLGASLQTPSLWLTGGYNASVFEENASAAPLIRSELANGSFRASSPVKIGLGAGYERGRLRFESNVFFYTHAGDATSANLHVNRVAGANGAPVASDVDIHATTASRAVVNAGLGFEYFLDQGLSVLGGVGTDFSAAPELPRAPALGEVYQSRVNRLRPTIGFGYYGDRRGVLVGAEFELGWGQVNALNSFTSPLSYTPVHQSTFGVLFIIAGSTNLSLLRRAAADVAGVFTGKESPEGHAAGPMK